MNNLFIKMDTGGVLGHHAVSQDYTYAEDIASQLVSEFHPEATSHEWVIADPAPVKDHCVATGHDTDNFEISQKSDVPGTHTIFLPEGVVIGDVEDTDLVLHCLTAPPAE